MGLFDKLKGEKGERLTGVMLITLCLNFTGNQMAVRLAQSL